jgi:hypothetical protein
MAGTSVKVADNVVAVPALSYWSHTSSTVDAATGVGKLCASEASLVDETPTANDVFAVSMAEVVAFRCANANGITHKATNKSR